MIFPFPANYYPAGQEVKPRDQPVPDDTLSLTVNDSGVDGVPASSNDTPMPTDYFVPSSALNRPQPWITQTSGTNVSPTFPTTVPAPDLPASSSITPSTSTLQPTPTTVSIEGGALSTGSSSNKKYIIGGAVGGGVFVLILLVLLLFCCRKRRGKKDLEHSGGGQSEHGYGQFAYCDHGACNKSGGQAQMEQKTLLRPFTLKSDPVAPTREERPQRHNVPPNRRDSSESQASAGSDTTETLCSSDSESSQRGRRRSQKRPPPLRLTSLVTPVINSLQNNTRRRVDHPSPPNLHEAPAIIVNPPQSGTPDRMRRH